MTGEYRASATLNGYEVNTFNGAGVVQNGFNKYTGNKSEWLIMANAYADLGTWWCVTPFIGAGVGAARVTIANYTDVGQTTQQQRLPWWSELGLRRPTRRSGISPGPFTRVLPTRSIRA